MKKFTYKTYTVAQKAMIGGKKLLATAKRHLAIEMGRAVTQQIEPYLQPEVIDEAKGITRYVAEFQLLTKQQEQQITKLLLPLKTNEPVDAATCQKIRMDVIAVLMEPLGTVHDEIIVEASEHEFVQDGPLKGHVINKL